MGFDNVVSLPDGAPKEAKFNEQDARFTALENCPLAAKKVILFTDNDDAGKKAAEKIEEVCGRLYRLYFPNFSANDVADLNVDSVTSDIKPFIQQAMDVYKEI